MRIGTFLAGVTTLVVAVVTLALVVVLARQERSRALDSKEVAGGMVTDLFAASVSPGVVFEDGDAVKADLANLGHNADVVGALIASDKVLVPMATLGEPIPLRAHAPVEISEDRMIITRRILDRDGHAVAYCRVAFSLQRENEVLRSTRRSLAVSGVVVMIFVVVLLTGFTRRKVVAPLRRLAMVAERIRRGELSARAGGVAAGTEEIDQLARTFDLMSHAIAEREGRLRGELQVAADLQVSVLPRETAVDTLDVSASMKPATEVGGDYYDIIPTTTGCWIGIGDVSGHGLGAGVVMLMLQSAIAALVQANPAVSPTEVECVVNRVLYENIRRRMGRRDHATLTILRYDSDGTVRFAGAHEDLLIYRAATGEVELLETPGTWVGAMQDVTAATTESMFWLGHDDVLVLYTDGVTEARKSKAQFGLDRLADVVRAAAGAGAASAMSIRDAIASAVDAWADSNDDDISVVVLRHKGSHAH